MKKSLIFVGMLSIGFAYAQKGNVGINSNKPKATLDIQPNADNARVDATTNQGILAPRLSKVRVANIETPVEGTLVYVTDETTSPISAYTGADNKVAKITEKGYYFYNGTEWVKAGADGELWAQRNNTGRTETYLKAADTDGNKLFYSRSPEDTGLFYIGNSFDSSNTVATHITDKGLFSRRYNVTGYGASLLLGSGRGTYANPEDNKVGDNIGRVVWEPTLKGSVGWGAAVSTFISEIKNEGGQVKYATNLILGARALDRTIPNYTMIINGKTDRVGIGLGGAEPEEKLDIQGNLKVRGIIKANGDISTEQGAIYAKGSGNIGSSITLQNNSKESDNQAYQWKIYNMTSANPSGNGGYKNALTFWSYNKNNVSSPSNRPQFIITDDGKVEIGGSSIYSNTPELKAKLNVVGTIMSTTLAQTGAGDRVVYADENGVLKTGVSAAANVKLATTNNVECTEANTGTMNFGSINIEGKATEAFGFCMKNSEGEYQWYYIYGGAGITTGQGAFGQGLQ